MADNDNDSKTEQATDKHVQQAHDQGRFAKAPEIGVVLSLCAALATLSLTMNSATHEIGSYASNLFAHLAAGKAELSTTPPQLADGMLVVAKILTPILGGSVLAAFLAGGLQSGFALTPEVIGIRFENLDPSSGFQRLMSQSVWVHALVDMMKMVGIGMILWIAARALFEDPMFSTPVEVAYLGRFYQTTTYSFLSRVILALGTIGAISFGFEYFKNKKQLMMTREEVKEESKQAEGDANTKGAMRRMARRLIQRQMLAAVPTADVVVTNPTHYAVALKYERGKDQAPVVLAKGENRFALRIKALAAEHGVPIVENKPVARALYAVSKVGEGIPPQLFQAVAEILAFVYRTHRYYFYQLRTRRAATETVTRIS